MDCSAGKRHCHEKERMPSKPIILAVSLGDPTSWDLAHLGVAATEIERRQGRSYGYGWHSPVPIGVMRWSGPSSKCHLC